ncbi:polysaccharide pyruvyl transferase family protein [Rhodococcus ruber]|uniref:polysaccharide pyruvyl transferase family protein n=1 Tax=Rhodococcus ruber TaxID=1830 RepID=UPI001F354212|nr:polysaccharide pyruvyl transferase family protein [Rhodococcus ruber]MCF8781349.1 polysaccharide pyruvyl transferase family protein [Rhodococcus ruber]
MTHNQPDKAPGAQSHVKFTSSIDDPSYKEPTLKPTRAISKDKVRIQLLSTWSKAHLHRRSAQTGNRVGILAGYGNSSYGDYYIGLGLAEAARAAGLEPVILGRDSDMRAFTGDGIEAHSLRDRDRGLRAFATIANTLDFLVLGGGGLFEDRVDAPSSQLLAAGYAARALHAANRRIPMAVYGIGVETEPYLFHKTEKLLRHAMTAASSVAVRDSASVRACRRFNVTARQVIDPATIYLARKQPINSAQCAETAAFIPFARRAWPNMTRPGPAEFASQRIDWEHAADRLKPYKKILVVPFHATDLNFTNQIAHVFRARLPRASVSIAQFSPESPNYALEILAQCGHALTMRYHGFMASHYAGVHTITTIGTSQKLQVTDALYKSHALAAHWNSEVATRQAVETLNQLAQTRRHRPHKE